MIWMTFFTPIPLILTWEIFCQQQQKIVYICIYASAYLITVCIGKKDIWKKYIYIACMWLECVLHWWGRHGEKFPHQQNYRSSPP